MSWPFITSDGSDKTAEPKKVKISTLPDIAGGYSISVSDIVIRNDDAAQKARVLYAARRARERVFNSDDLFAEPAWDMLLYLFISENECKQSSVSAVASAGMVAPTTGYRWIYVLEKRGLVSREADPFDKRRANISLTDVARELIARAVTVS